MVADKGASEQSVSGEVRLVEDWENGHAHHRLIASARGRKKDRNFGGGQRIDLGASTILTSDVSDAPVLAFGPKNRDEARQVQLGATYSLLLGEQFGFDLGISQSWYEKEIDYANPLTDDTTTADQRRLWNSSASYRFSPGLTFFGGVARGLEEAPIAPDRAVNRSEAPPAIATKQEEVGIRLDMGGTVNLVTGVFRLSKPYYNLDPTQRYRSLGTVMIEGVEFSLAGSPMPGVSVVAGSVFMNPKILGEAVAIGLIGPHPVGQAQRRSTVNIDWRLDAGRSPVSLDLALESASSTYVDAENTILAPGYMSFDLGVRYRFSLAETPMVLRPKIENLLNEFSWRVSQNGGLTYSAERNYSLQLIADF